MTMLSGFEELSTCGRRKIAAIIHDEVGAVLGIGANGPLHCECNCPAKGTQPGTGPSDCFGVHAEIRALMNVNLFDRRDMYSIECTKAPCLACTRVLLGTPIQRVIFHIPSNETENRDLWLKYGRKWEQAE